MMKTTPPNTPTLGAVRFHYLQSAPGRQTVETHLDQGASSRAGAEGMEAAQTRRNVTVLPATAAPAASAAAAMAVASIAIDAAAPPLASAQHQPLGLEQPGPSRAEAAACCTLASAVVGTATGALCGGIAGVTYGSAYFAGTVGMGYCILKYGDHANPPSSTPPKR